MKNRITPDNITELRPNEVFVFESTSSASSLLTSNMIEQAIKWGAHLGVAFGKQGSTFAIPTRFFLNQGKECIKIELMSLELIKSYVVEFIEIANKYYLDKVFLVTPIGCSISAYTPDEIAPMFESAIDKENIHLPKSFWKILMP